MNDDLKARKKQHLGPAAKRISPEKGIPFKGPDIFAGLSVDCMTQDLEDPNLGFKLNFI